MEEFREKTCLTWFGGDEDGSGQESWETKSVAAGVADVRVLSGAAGIGLLLGRVLLLLSDWYLVWGWNSLVPLLYCKHLPELAQLFVQLQCLPLLFGQCRIGVRII